MRDGLFESAAQHFELYGFHEGRDPNQVFSTTYYLSQYTDILEADINPLTHFEQFGVAEGRQISDISDVTFYLQANQDVADAGVDPLSHFLAYGAKEGRKPTQFFDAELYLEQHPEAKKQVDSHELTACNAPVLTSGF